MIRIYQTPEMAATLRMIERVEYERRASEAAKRAALVRQILWILS